MEKLLCNITSEGAKGRVEIIGSISEWNENSAANFRNRCKESKEAGVKECTVYLMTSGGDCFQANEIINILNDNFGTYEAEGGSLVASAGTYIAVCASKFTLAHNGNMMIHKPSVYVSGNETEIENDLKLLKNITEDYYSKYIAKLKKPEQDFKTKWESGDFWLSAKDAQEWGFVDGIREPKKTDAKTEDFISSILAEMQDNKLTNNNKMKDLAKLLIVAFAISEVNEESTKEQIVEAVKKKFNDLKAENETLKTRIQAQIDNSIKVILDEAQAQGKIFASNGKKVEDIRSTYEHIGKTSGIDALIAVINELKAQEHIVDKIKKEGKSPEGEIKTLADVLAKGSEFAIAFKAEQRAEYNKLYKAEFGHEPTV